MGSECNYLYVEDLYLQFIKGQIDRDEYYSGLHDLLSGGVISELEWYFGTHLLSGYREPTQLEEHEGEETPAMASSEFVTGWAVSE